MQDEFPKSLFGNSPGQGTGPTGSAGFGCFLQAACPHAAFRWSFQTGSKARTDMNYTNPLKRFIFRRDLYKRLKARLAAYERRLTKNEMPDLVSLFRGENPQVILDVGANVGFVTWQFATAFKNAVIYALEPDPVPRRILESTHGSHPRVRIFPVAAADRQGELAFVQRGVSCNSSLLELATDARGHRENTIRVQASTLDRFCAEHSITHIDLLKTDTEGADLLVLQGAQGLLGRGAIEVVMAEVFFVPTYQGQATFDEIAGFLKTYGFALFNLYIGRETPGGQACYGNAIFVGRRLQQALGKAR
jgi:FkbM family methyltransferase